MAGIVSQLAPHINQQPREIVSKQTGDFVSTPYPPVVYSIAHALPGRVGFCIPQISGDAIYLKRLQTLLNSQSGVISQQVNTTAGSIVITYKSGIMSDSEMRSHLASLIQAANHDVPAIEQPVNSSLEKVDRKEDVKTVTKGDEHREEQTEITTQEDAEIEKSNDAATENFPMSPLPRVPVSSSLTSPSQELTKVAYSIAHAIPGRIRFRVPRIAQDPTYVQRLEALFKKDPAVTNERVNRSAASIVITYQPGKIFNSQKLCSNVVEQAISYLSRLIQSAAIDNSCYGVKS
ncbi:MAG: hypothetical protein SAK29_13635 [Scytonema sp. PMC 1069.18]|nr:hypothetical protein [Scytonema sp. PMC 1069.18]MEC4886283.1 hypothetical protein [Scytonema sp. PMC 1070.18]